MLGVRENGPLGSPQWPNGYRSKNHFSAINLIYCSPSLSPSLPLLLSVPTPPSPIFCVYICVRIISVVMNWCIYFHLVFLLLNTSSFDVAGYNAFLKSQTISEPFLSKRKYTQCSRPMVRQEITTQVIFWKFPFMQESVTSHLHKLNYRHV